MKNRYSLQEVSLIKERANYKCELCGDIYDLHAHAPNGDHSNWENGQCLCIHCHFGLHRPLKTSMVGIGCFANKEAKNKLHELAAETNISYSEHIRRAIDQYLRREKGK